MDKVRVTRHFNVLVFTHPEDQPVKIGEAVQHLNKVGRLSADDEWGEIKITFNRNMGFIFIDGDNIFLKEVKS